jgi:uncharacterized membrane protein
LRHTGEQRVLYPVLGTVLLGMAAWLAAPVRPDTAVQTVDIGTIETIVAARCTQCHAAQPTQAGFASAAGGLDLGSPEMLTQHADQIKQAVATRYMPLGNLTKMTESERAAISAWNASHQRPAPR